MSHAFSHTNSKCFIPKEVKGLKQIGNGQVGELQDSIDDTDYCPVAADTLLPLTKLLPATQLCSKTCFSNVGYVAAPCLVPALHSKMPCGSWARK